MRKCVFVTDMPISMVNTTTVTKIITKGLILFMQISIYLKH